MNGFDLFALSDAKGHALWPMVQLSLQAWCDIYDEVGCRDQLNLSLAHPTPASPSLAKPCSSSQYICAGDRFFSLFTDMIKSH